MKYILLLVLSASVLANDISDRIKKFNWGNLEVTWLEDNRYPTYDVIMYFADGALSDGSRKGSTSMMFDLITAGTNRFDNKDIVDNLDYYGVSYGATVYHEYSRYSISGLVKDIMPTMKKVCHLFKDSIYPTKEVNKERKLLINSRKNMINSHGKLASYAFRAINLKGTPFVTPVKGKIKSIKKIKSKHLQNKLSYFNNKVKKKIYISGPKSALQIERVLLEECGWNPEAKFERKVSYKYKKNKRAPRIHLVTVPKANQAQVVAGKFLQKGEFENFEKLNITSTYLGDGNMSSILMNELRVKRGLTYSAYAYAGGQKDYGRSIIKTFTKEQTITELIKVLETTINDLSSGKVTDKKLSEIKRSIKGAYPFQFESSTRFINELLNYDHIGMSYQRFFNFNKTIDSFSKEDITKGMQMLFPWDGMDIVILGEKKLASKLKKLGKVKIHNYRTFL